MKWFKSLLKSECSKPEVVPSSPAQEFEVIQFQSSYSFQNYFFTDYRFFESGEPDRLITEEEWKTVIHTGQINQLKDCHVFFSILRSMPFYIRRELWCTLAKVKALKEKHPDFIFEEQALRKPACQSCIEKDVVRTFSNLSFFKTGRGRDQLRKILRAYANFDPETGYPQGLNSIVGNILLLMDIEWNDVEARKQTIVIQEELEERVFWITVHIMQTLGWKKIFQPSSQKLLQTIETLRAKLKQFFPEVLRVIEDLGLDMYVCFGHYYLTLMLYKTPELMASKIIDLFLYFGEVVIHSLILQMVLLEKTNIVNTKCPARLVKLLKQDLIANMSAKIEAESSYGDFKQSCLNYFRIIQQ